MNTCRTAIRIVTVLMMGALLQGCATNLRKPASAPAPAKQKLGTFKTVQMAPVEVSPAFAKSGANLKAAKKINENLISNMKLVLPNLTVGSEAAVKGALLIEPVVEEIKFIGGFARYMVGAMAGSSAVLMKVTYTDTGSGKVVAEPEFYRQASAMTGGYSMGSTDNAMLTEIARDIANYTKMNY